MEEQDWDEVIQPTHSLLKLNLKEVFKYWDLLTLFVRRDFVANYKQTVLGPFWFFIQPILSTITFTIIFGKIAKISTDGTPPILFYLGGLTLWNYFSTNLTSCSNTFIANQGIFGKVYFPRLVVPLSTSISNLIKLGIQLLLFLCIWSFYTLKGDVHANYYILLFPVLLIITTICSMSMGIIISSLTTKYRDFSFLLGFGVQLLMYASPIIYPFSIIPEKFQWLVLINPMASVIETFKLGFLGNGVFLPLGLLYSFIISIVLFLFGVIIFNKTEKSFMDTV